MKLRLRLFAILMSLTMVLTYMPAMVFAEDNIQSDAEKKVKNNYYDGDSNYEESPEQIVDEGEETDYIVGDDKAFQGMAEEDPDAIESDGILVDETYEAEGDGDAVQVEQKKSNALLRSATEATEGDDEEPAEGPAYELNEGVLVVSGTGAIDADLYKGNKEITELIIEEGITSIGSSAFANCTSLQSISFPLSLTTIGESAFSGCTGLQALNLTEGIIDIEASAFKGDTSLTEVYIPLNIQNATVRYTYNTSSNIAWGIFDGCKSLSTVNFAEGTEHIHSGMFAGSGLRAVVLPDTINQIGEYAFANCVSLETVELSEELTEIKEFAFSACTALTGIDFTEKITTIGKGAFRNDTALTDVYIPLSVQTGSVMYSYNNDSKRAWGIFEGCKNLTTVTFAEGTEYIHSGLFAGSGIKEVVLPDTVKSVYAYAFGSCSSLTSVDFNNVQEITKYAFVSCTALNPLTLPETLTSIGEYAFCGCKSITSLTIPSTVTNIGGRAFESCTGLKDLSIPAAFMNSGDYIYTYNTSSYKAWGPFNECSGLRNVYLEEGTTRIPAGLFSGTGIAEIELPDTITSIYAYAFSNTSLKKITIPDTVTNLGFSAFSMCTLLEEVNMPKGWKKCTGFNGSTGTSAQGSLFRGCTALSYVILPDGMESIPDYAFANCDSLAFIGIPYSVQTIGKYAFYNCAALTSLDIPEGVETLPESSLNNCTKLIGLNIPKSVKTVEANALANCTAVSRINYAGSDSDWKGISISQTGNSAANDVVINYDFKVTYTTKDFEGVWDGEYDGNSDGTVVRRHFVLEVDNCTIIAGDCAEISGTRTISQSLENPSSLYVEGSDKFRGIVNLKTGAMAFQGYEWIVYPVGEHSYSNFNHISYEGFIEADKESMVGINSGLKTRTYHAEKLLNGKDSATVVIMSIGNKKYDLLSDPVDFTAGDETLATIIVKPDWMGNKQGKIRLFQRDVAVESKTGVFIDIKPGAIFKPDSSIFAALVDSDGNVVDTKKLTLVISSEINSRLSSSTKDLNLQISKNKYLSTVEKDKYIVCTDAQVDNGLTIIKTNKNGVCKIPDVGAGSVTISAPGCITRSFTGGQLQKNTNIHLQKKNKNGPVISGVWIGDTDVLNSDYALSMVSKEKVTLDLEIDWGTSSYGSVTLLQKQHTAAFSGNQLTTVISNNFNTAETIYIIATDADGRTTKKSLKFQNGEADKVLNNYSGLSFSTAGKINVKIPNNFKPDILAGQEFGVSLSGVENMVPVTLTAENGKVYASIGFVVASGSYSETTQGDQTKTKLEQKRFINEFKRRDLVNITEAKKGIKELKDLKKNFKKGIKAPKGKFGVDADVTILGFAEGTYDQNGKITWLDAGAIAAPTTSISKTWPKVVPIGPVPVPFFFEVEFTGEAFAQLNLIFAEAAKNFTPNGTISGKLALAGSLGIGVPKVIYGQGGLEGALKPKWEIALKGTDYFNIVATLAAFIKGGIGPFSGKWESDPFVEKTLLEYPEPLKNRISSLLGGSKGSMYDSEAYHLKDLSYLNEASVFNNGAAGRRNIKSLRSGGQTASSMVMKTNIYKESIPQIVLFSNGTRLAVWMDGASDDMNKEYLYYSVYKSGVWSDPQIVLQDGTMDYSPYLTVIGDTAYLAWQNATQDFAASPDLTLEDIGEYFDISVGTFNKDTDSFEADTIANPHLDNTPVICGEEESVYVAWVNNSENNWFGDNNKNSILYSVKDGDTWSVPVTAYDGLMSILGFDADYDGEIKFAYGMDTDANISTEEDVRVFENGEQKSADALSRNPSYYNHELYWYSNNNIVSAKTADKTAELSVGQYSLVNISGRKAMLYTSGNGLGSSLVVSYYNTETESWGKGTTLTDGNDFVGAFSAVGDGDHLVMLANRSEITGTINEDGQDPYGASNLWLLETEPVYDLSLDEVSYQDSSFCEGKDMSFDCVVTNEGNTSLSGAVLEIRAENGDVLGTREIEELIVPGESAESSITYSVPEGIQGQNLVFAITMPEGVTDADASNNTQNVTLSYEAAFVENADYEYTEEGAAVVFASIVNRGYHDRTGLTVSLVKASEDNDFDLQNAEAIETKSVNKIAPLATYSAEFVIDAEYNDAFYVALKDADGNLVDSEIVAIYEKFEQHEHQYGEWKVIEEPTCSKTGLKERACEICGDAETEVIPVTNHHWSVVEVTTTPTSETEGKMSVKCTDCGHTDVITIPKLNKDQEAAYEALDDAVETVKHAQTEAAGVDNTASEQMMEDADVTVSEAVDVAQAAEKAVEEVYKKISSEQGQGSDAATYAQIQYDRARENTAAAMMASAEVKAVAAEIADQKADAAMAAAAVAAYTPGAAAVNAAVAAETAAKESAEKAAIAKEAADAALEAVIAAGYKTDSPEYKAAETLVNETAEKKRKADEKVTAAASALAAAQSAKAQADAAASAATVSAVPSEIVDLPSVKISKPKAAKKAVTVKWKKVTKKNLKKIQGVEIEIATDAGFVNIVKLSFYNL